MNCSFDFGDFVFFGHIICIEHSSIFIGVAVWGIGTLVSRAKSYGIGMNFKRIFLKKF